ncbi:unnamed protein product [Mucor fragilis]
MYHTTGVNAGGIHCPVMPSTNDSGNITAYSQVSLTRFLGPSVSSTNHAIGVSVTSTSTSTTRNIFAGISAAARAASPASLCFQQKAP